MSYHKSEYMDDFYEDYVNEELEDLKTNARDYLTGVMENLYGNKFDALNLEHCLEELCHVLGCPFKCEENLKICAVQTKSPILQDWMQFNNNYLKAIA